MWVSYPLKLWKKHRNVEWILLALLVLPETKLYIAFTMSCSTVFSTHMAMLSHTIFSHQLMTDVTMSSFIKIFLILRSQNFPTKDILNYNVENNVFARILFPADSH